MTAKAIEVMKSDSEHADTDVGLVHISGCGFNTHETLCGNVDTFTKYKETRKKPKCLGCIEAFLEIKNSKIKL